MPVENKKDVELKIKNYADQGDFVMARKVARHFMGQFGFDINKAEYDIMKMEEKSKQPKPPKTENKK
jgi:hypothetical protein